MYDLITMEQDASPCFEAYVSQDRCLPNELLAIIRLTWLDDNRRVMEVGEFAIKKKGQFPEAMFRNVIAAVGQCGAEVYVICGCEPKVLGFHS